MFRYFLVRSAVATVFYGSRQHSLNCSSSGSNKEEGNDFVIAGLGVAGSAALETLLVELERRGVLNKRIVVVDSAIDDRVLVSRGSKVTFIGGTVRRLSTRERILLLSNNTKVSFKKLLIATGQSSVGFADSPFVDASVGESRLLSAASPVADIALKERAHSREHATFVGANSWAVLSLLHEFLQESRAAGVKGSASLLYPGYGVLSNLLPRHLSIAVTRRLQSLGVELLPYHQLQYVSERGGALEVYTNYTYDSLHTGRFHTHVLCFTGQGMFPLGRHFAERAGLEVHPEGGLLLTPNLQSRCGIYAAGDVASVPTSNGRFVFGGSGHARRSGAVAALNMLCSSLGESSAEYDAVPSSSYSFEQWGLHFIAAGACSSSMDMHTFHWRIGNSNSKKASPGKRVTSADSPQGLRRLSHRLSISARDSRPPPSPGISVTFYTEGGVVMGVMVMGVPVQEVVAHAATKCIGINIWTLTDSISDVDVDDDDEEEEDNEEEEKEEQVLASFETERLLTVQRMAAYASRIVAPTMELPPGQTLPRPTYLFSHPSRMNSSRNNENEKIFNSGNTGSVKNNISQAYKTGAARASF